METDRLCATWGYHFYGEARVEAVSIEVDKATSRHLGLLIFARVFHRQAPRVVVKLTHPRSSLRRLIIGAEETDQRLDPVRAPHTFAYSPERPGRYPWLSLDISPSCFPSLSIANADETVSSADELSSRDTVTGFGPDEGACRLAELLLNAGQPDHDVDEYALEGERGLRGVGPSSAELKIWLPGSLGHLDSEPAYL